MGTGQGGWGGCGWLGGREAAMKAPGEAPVAVDTPSVPEPSGSQVLVFQDVTIRGNGVKGKGKLSALFLELNCESVIASK